MVREQLKKKVIKGTIWALIERFSVQFVQFAVTMVLARLLTPSDYGLVALVGSCIALADVLVDSGFGNALIQKKEVSENDYNSVFYLCLFVSALIYIFLFCFAPMIARFYESPTFSSVLRVFSLILIINAFNSIQNAELNRKMMFDVSFRIGLVSSVIAALIGIALALYGAGVWALVYSQMIGALIGVILQWRIIAWRPRCMFSIDAIRPLFKYSWKLTAGAFLDTAYRNLYSFLIGKWYTKADLAYVNRGKQLPNLLMMNINGSLCRAFFPALSQMQEDRERLRESMRRMIRMSAFFVFPLLAVLAATASSTISFLFGDQWHSAVIYVQLACVGFLLYPTSSINMQALQALGRTDCYLWIEIVKKTWGIAVMLAFLPKGLVLFMTVGSFVSGPLGALVNVWPNRKLLRYGYLAQIADLMPAILLSGAAFICMIGVCSCVQMPDLCMIFSQAIIGISVYVALALFFKVRELRDVINMAKGLIYNCKRA